MADSIAPNGPESLGALTDPDENGLRLLTGFASRVVARSGEAPVAASPYVWHPAPDGGACFADADRGWIYVSNSEMSGGRGGVGALRFAADGNLTEAYSILSGTHRNCAGGATPWGTWLSCEEVSRGRVFECDPKGDRPAQERPALGRFNHEAAAVDLANRHVYLTEDKKDGGLYRFTAEADADGRLDLSDGRLEIAQVLGRVGGPVAWHRVPDPSGASARTRYQVPESTGFNGGEGIVFHDGTVHFATKGDNRIWAYDTAAQRLSVLYDDDFFANAILKDVDNITVYGDGLLFVAEDGDDMQIVIVDPRGRVFPFLQVDGQPDSEVTGPAFSPAGDRLYFSSQRGVSGTSESGITYEVTGPFGRLVA